ncbi:unnamed protein product, partial [Ectocarpus sp. 13 AM-2016]
NDALFGYPAILCRCSASYRLAVLAEGSRKFCLLERVVVASSVAFRPTSFHCEVCRWVLLFLLAFDVIISGQQLVDDFSFSCSSYLRLRCACAKHPVCQWVTPAAHRLLVVPAHWYRHIGT